MICIIRTDDLLQEEKSASDKVGPKQRIVISWLFPFV